MNTATPARSRWAILLRSADHVLLLGPRAVADGVAVLRGRADTAAALQRALVGDDLGSPADPPGARRVLAHAVLSLVLWCPALVLLGAFVLAVLRGLVDCGPYTDAWGGPTLAGAWAVHALVSLAILGATGLGVLGLAALHTRTTHRLLGAGGPGWAIPAALLTGVATLLLIIAWSRQI